MASASSLDCEKSSAATSLRGALALSSSGGWLATRSASDRRIDEYLCRACVDVTDRLARERFTNIGSFEADPEREVMTCSVAIPAET
jgi:hypothetical protein